MNLPIQPSSAYNLNEGQKAAAEAFLSFLFSPEKELIISGPAGVGKTFLMNYIIDNTMPRYHEMCKLIGIKPEYTEVVMTATTNKAADVLSQSVGRPASTVQSFFNLTVKDDYATGTTSLKKTQRWIVHSKKIIFVDECSMIDTELWKMLHDGTADCKLVYVGDRHQLAPVQESLSPVYRHNAPMVELLQPVRNANQPALMAICQQLRETVATGIFKPILVVPGVIDLLDSQAMQDEIAMVHHKAGQVPIEMELEVLRNHGASRLQIDREHDVWLDIDKLDLQNSFGEVLRDIPVMTNRPHFDDLVKYYARAKKWTTYFFLKNNIADLRPRDAATVHKAQGSTYETVFADLDNISTCRIPSQAARMLYVTFSRAKSRVFLYGTLADKFGGLILP